MARNKDNVTTTDSLLSDELKLALRKKAKEQVEADSRKKEEDAYLKKMLKEEREAAARAAGNPDDYEVTTITIDLPGHAANIPLDGTVYHHGFTYSVPRIVASSLLDIQARAWEHNRDIHGEKWRNLKSKSGIRVDRYGANNG